MAGPTLEIEPPVRAPREGGIENVAEIRTNERLGAVQSVVFQSDGCTFPEISEHLCYVGETVPDDKVFDGIDIDGAIGEPFPLYAGIKCFAGPDTDDFAARARAALAAGQGRLLEAALYAWANAATAITTPAGAGVAGALARVEQAIDLNYLGRGVIVMSRFDASIAATGGTLVMKDGQLQTILGTPVIATSRAAAGTVLGTGAIVIEHSTVKDVDTIDVTTNQKYALAEAVYILAVDCEYRVKSAIV